jgi:23S rRNA (cytosine1962-C5)-methyltransferase
MGMKHWHTTLARLPALSDATVTVHASASAAKHLRRGHPWLFDGGITKTNREGAAGDVAVVFDQKRKMVGLGLFDPQVPIRVKMLLRRGGVPIDQAFVAQRLAEAAARRAALPASKTDGYRLVHGENDGLPGLVVDRYAECLVIKVYSAIWWPRLTQVVAALLEQEKPQHIVLRVSRNLMDSAASYGLSDGELLHGKPLPETLTFREHGLVFEVDVRRGQKTGFFLDQRDNRKRVEGFAKGADVLNVFAYTGGFSLYASRGGAGSVVSLDASRPALEAAQRNMRLNPSLKASHEVLCGDAFAEMSTLAKAGRLFDLVIIDPPSFARRQSEVEAASKAYGRLARLGLSLLKPNGLIVLASCSSRMPMTSFRSLMERAARQVGRPLSIIETSAHAEDHPIDFDEGAYLKCLFARA